VPTAAARDAMIDAAEGLVAERGLRNVSLREVQATAGQRNKSAAQYHFGSLHGLIEAVVLARMAPIDARRVRLLAELDAAGHGRDVRTLVEAAIDPFAEATLGRPGSRYARFLAQVMADPGMSGLAARDLQADGLALVHERLVAAMATVPVPLRAGRIRRSFVFGVVSVASWEGGPVDEPPVRSARIADLVDTCVAILEAPASPRTRAALAAGTEAATGTGLNATTTQDGS